MGLTGERRLLIEPEGLAPAFLLVCSARRIRLTVLGRGREHAARTADARIRGPFLDLIDLLGGGDDGDARFFSRVLSIEGDTEVVVALRNVIDTAELDPLRDLLPIPAPLAPLVRRGTSCLAGLARTAATDLGNVERVLLQIAGGDDGDLR